MSESRYWYILALQPQRADNNIEKLALIKFAPDITITNNVSNMNGSIELIIF